jgi:hypothetical protein
MNDHPDTIELLKLRVDALEQRVHLLEETIAPHAAMADQPVIPPTAEPFVPAPASQQPGSILLIMGKAMLGIAGAYVLRALAESTPLPRLLIAIVAILYALAWLVFSVRVAGEARLPRIIYASTSALILAPMLWELTLRFHVLSAGSSAIVLGLFAATATLLALKREQPPEFAVAYSAAAFTALALSIATHVMLPYLALLLLMFAACEYRSVRQGGWILRSLLAIVMDCALWILVYLYRMPPASRSDYPELPAGALILPAILFFVLFASSLALRSIWQRRNISSYDTVQAIIAFFLAIASLEYLLPGFYPAGAGICCLGLAAACYAVAWGIFRPASLMRNFFILAVWSAALFLAGVSLSFSTNWKLAALVSAAVASALLAGRICCTALECHATVYLLVAAGVSGFLEYSIAVLAGSMPSRTTAGVLIFAVCAILCYLAARRRRGQWNWLEYALVFVPAMLTAFASAALLAFAASRFAGLVISLDVSRTAVIRTLALCLVALALAYWGAHGRRFELTRIAYVTLATVALKLAFDDLRHGHMELIALSIALFAFTLIAVPRLARTRNGS